MTIAQDRPVDTRTADGAADGAADRAAVRAGTTPKPPRGERRALVLGGGGVLGFAWMVGALTVLKEETGWDPRDASHLVGTSAGAVLAATLACGVGVDNLARHQEGLLVEGDHQIGFRHDVDSGGPLPPAPALRPGSPELLRRTLRSPRRFPPMVVFFSLMPEGRGELPAVTREVETIVPTGWAPHPNAWMIALDYETGRRIPFGKEDAPPADLKDAVTASCTIPGWFTSVEIGGRRYVDGGVWSPFSVDLLSREDVDEVLVLGPMASFHYDQPRDVATRIERRLRRAATERLLREGNKVRRNGTPVRFLTPGPEDLEAFGYNLMDPRRRPTVFAVAQRTTRRLLREQGIPTLRP